MGTITMTGFSVDADGDLSGKSLISTSTVSGSGVISGASFAADGGININSNNFVVSAAGLATSTGLNVNDQFTVSGAGAVSGSSTLEIVGEATLGGALNVSGAVDMDNTSITFGGNLDNAFVLASDALYYRDATDGGLKSRPWSTIMGQAAGAGITNTNGVLSVSAVSTPTAFASTNVTLVEGLNYASADWDDAYTLTLPNSDDLDVGESVKIKMMTGVSTTNTASIVIADGSGDLIDGAASIVLESPYAAVGLFKVAADLWRIL